MTTTTSTFALRTCACFAALIAPSYDPSHPAALRHATANAQAPDTVEKDAFDAAKELGTVEAWDAFLSNYSTGFRADLARAYVKKLAEQTPAAATSQAASPPPSGAADPNNDFPTVAGSWGGIVRSGPGQQYKKIESLEEGEQITLMGRTEVFENGYPWFKIAYRDGEIGYKWGGILCSANAPRPDLFQTCPPAPSRETESRRSETKREPKGCGSGRINIDGRCIRKADASTHCGPGYRLRGNTCVQGYQEPAPQRQRPSWQVDGMQHGCKPGMAWNAQEGCHEND